jgi:hypothetical protein
VIPKISGTYREGKSHANIVTLNGSSFIARGDDPGRCPGDGWQLIASAGKPGPKGKRSEQGPRGERGPAGPAGPTIQRWQVDWERYQATPLMSDGREGPPLELRSLFEQFHTEAR